MDMSNWENMSCFKTSKTTVIWFSTSDNTAAISCTNSIAKMFSLFMNVTSETFSLYDGNEQLT